MPLQRYELTTFKVTTRRSTTELLWLMIFGLLFYFTSRWFGGTPKWGNTKIKYPLLVNQVTNELYNYYRYLYWIFLGILWQCVVHILYKLYLFLLFYDEAWKCKTLQGAWSSFLSLFIDDWKWYPKLFFSIMFNLL